MTRGRTGNIAHLVAADWADARDQWVAVFGRDRADLGPGHAAELAAREAALYATPQPLDQVLAELHEAWTAEQRCLDRLTLQQPLSDALRTIVALETGQADRLEALEAGCRQAAADAERAEERAEASGVLVAGQAEQLRSAMLTRWDAERNAAHQAAHIVLHGPGRLGLRRGAVARAAGQLTDWANRWRAHLPDLPADPGRIAQVAGRLDHRPALEAAFDITARRAAEDAHPEHAALRAAADAARRVSEEARRSLTDARRRHDQQLAGLGAVAWSPDPASRLAEIERDIATTRQSLTDARARMAQLRAEPALLAQSPDRLAAERDAWRATRDADRHRQRASLSQPVAPTSGVPRPQPEHLGSSVARRDTAPGFRC